LTARPDGLPASAGRLDGYKAGCYPRLRLRVALGRLRPGKHYRQCAFVGRHGDPALLRSGNQAVLRSRVVRGPKPSGTNRDLLGSLHNEAAQWAVSSYDKQTGLPEISRGANIRGSFRGFPGTSLRDRRSRGPAMVSGIFGELLGYRESGLPGPPCLIAGVMEWLF
jgi:hypothetical protein